jgi:hypothetical protein
MGYRQIRLSKGFIGFNGENPGFWPGFFVLLFNCSGLGITLMQWVSALFSVIYEVFGLDR